MSNWEWYTGPVRFDTKCTGCQTLLGRGAELVKWKEGVYHVGCLLDKLTSDSKPADLTVWPNGFYLRGTPIK